MQKRLSKEGVARLHELADAGVSHKIIAERLGIADSVVSYHRIKIGERRHKQHKFKSKHVGKSKHESHDLIIKMIKAGNTYREIKEAAKCCHVTVWQYKKALLQNA